MASGIYNKFKSEITGTESMPGKRPGESQVEFQRRKAKEAREALKKKIFKVSASTQQDDDDEELRLILDDIDACEHDVTQWEAGFIESVLGQDKPLSPKQKAVIKRMAEQYL